MKKIIFIMTLTATVLFSSCGKVESKKESQDSSSVRKEIITEEVNQENLFEFDNSSFKLENNSLEKEVSSSKMEDSSSKAIINSKQEKNSSFLEEKKEDDNSFRRSTNIVVTDSCSDNHPILGEEVKPEIGPAPMDETPTLDEDIIPAIGCPTLQTLEKIVFKPSTHYIHRATCRWVNDECYEVKDTNNIEARICTECNPDIVIQNEYVEPTPTYSIDAYSRQLLAEIVWHEYGSDWVSIPEKARIAAGVMNRVNDSRFPSTVYTVLTQAGQFTGYWPGCCTPTQDCYDAVDYYFSHQNEFGCENSWWGDSYQNHFYYQ